MTQSYSPYFELDGTLENGLLIVCDHARNTLPERYNMIGLPKEAFERHIAYDIGVEEVVRKLSAALDAPAVLSNFSRLLIDPNRGTDDPTLIMRLSDGQIIPGNHPLDAIERQKRIEEFHQPYHDAISRRIDEFINNGITPAILSVHSFTPTWKNNPRPWHVAMLADIDTGFHGAMLAGLRKLSGIIVGDNEPYDGALKGDCMHIHGIKRGLQHALIELRQDLICNKKGQNVWATNLEPIIRDFIKDVSNRKRRYFSSRTGPYMREDGSIQE